MSFRNLEFISPSLNKAIQAYIDRIDATQRDRELLYDIVGFAFDEGRIQGKEDLINENLRFGDVKIGEETKNNIHDEEEK